jgi:hypothetical protein
MRTDRKTKPPRLFWFGQLINPYVSVDPEIGKSGRNTVRRKFRAPRGRFAIGSVAHWDGNATKTACRNLQIDNPTINL